MVTPLARRDFSGVAPDTTLSTALVAGGLSFSNSDGTGYPTGSQGNFFLVISPDTSLEEKILCSGRSGNAFTIPLGGRGFEGTSEQDHPIGAVVRHCLSKTDLDEANLAVSQTIAKVAGKGQLLAGSAPNTLVAVDPGANGAALIYDSSKPGGLSSGAPIPGVHDHSSSVLGGNIPESSVTGLVADLAAKSTALTTHAALTTGTHGVAGNIVGTTDAATLTNKTLTAPIIATIVNTGTLTLPASTDTLVGRATADTLTNKTMTAPVLNTPTVATPAVTGGTFAGGTFTAPVLNAPILTPIIPGSYTAVTANTTGIVGTGTDVVTAPAITGDGTTRVKITVGFDSISSTVDGDRFTLAIMEGATQLRSAQVREVWVTNNINFPGNDLSVVVTPSAGAHTYKFRVTRNAGTGSGSIAGAVGSPSFITVEQFQ